MIRSFRDRDTESLYAGRCPVRWRAIRPAAERKLQMLDSAADLTDLRSPPGNRLERLAGDRKGQYSVRIDDQWRVCFRWAEGGVWEFEIVDYH